VRKKTKKPRKSEKNNWKNRTIKKNRLKFWKNRPVQFDFGFISLKPKKPNRTQTEKNWAKLAKNRVKPKNQAKPVWTGFCPKKPNRIETGRFEPVPVRFRFFFIKKFSVVTFFDKNRTEPNRKWSLLLLYHDFMWL